jgi:hypothetical protein
MIQVCLGLGFRVKALGQCILAGRGVSGTQTSLKKKCQDEKTIPAGKDHNSTVRARKEADRIIDHQF